MVRIQKFSKRSTTAFAALIRKIFPNKSAKKCRVMFWMIAWFGMVLLLLCTTIAVHTIIDPRTIDQQVVSQNVVLKSPAIARPVFGTHRLIPLPANSAESLPPVEVVYATTTTTTTTTSMTDTVSPNPPNCKGVVLLLHACTHNALKFFSPHPETCPQCVGLSEELRITRTVQDRGYLPVAVTSRDRKRGCWSDADVPRLQHVLDTMHQDWFVNGRDNQNPNNKFPVVVAVGASSGGFMAAKVAASGLVKAALVMVMGLQPALLDKLAAQQTTLYLAPMPRDSATLQRSRQNYQTLIEATNTSARVVLDETSCVPLPLTVEYLMERVVGMTERHATSIIQALQAAGHVSGNYYNDNGAMFQKDPTRSDWRQVLLALPGARSNSSNSQNGNEEEDMLWGTFRLTPGRSPLAKAFHRAWAFHEYCSESVPLALDFFENVWARDFASMGFSVMSTRLASLGVSSLHGKASC